MHKRVQAQRRLPPSTQACPGVPGKAVQYHRLVGRNSEEAASADPVVELLLSGRARDLHQAEEMYLDSHLDDVLRLSASQLSEAEFRRHPLIALLLAHGSRGFEDSLV